MDLTNKLHVEVASKYITKASTPPAAAIASRFLSSNDKFHNAPAASCLFNKQLKYYISDKILNACAYKESWLMDF
jgi:hypothetical protein